MAKCAQPFCGHYHSDIDGICISKGCTCTPELFIAVDPKNPGYQNFAYHQKILATMNDVAQKVQWLLEAIPGTRNMPDWEFESTYWHYALGFQFGHTWTREWFERINKDGQPETIRRAKQKVCHAELEILRTFQDLLKELQKESRDGRPEYHKLTEQMKNFWMNSKYVPTDWDLLRKKLIKENAIFQWSIEELNLIC
jgi:hypothetical protein